MSIINSNGFKIVWFFGVLTPVPHSCMLDSERDPGASQFVSRTDQSLRFSLKAFQFTSDPDTEVGACGL